MLPQFRGGGRLEYQMGVLGLRYPDVHVAGAEHNVENGFYTG